MTTCCSFGLVFKLPSSKLKHSNKKTKNPTQTGRLVFKLLVIINIPCQHRHTRRHDRRPHDAQKPEQADENHVGIEGVFVWVIRAAGDPVSHDTIAAAKPRLSLAVFALRLSARSIGLQRHLPIPGIPSWLIRKHRANWCRWLTLL